jgi:hypothetical protein
MAAVKYLQGFESPSKQRARSNAGIWADAGRRGHETCSESRSDRRICHTGVEIPDSRCRERFKVPKGLHPVYNKQVESGRPVGLSRRSASVSANIKLPIDHGVLWVTARDPREISERSLTKMTCASLLRRLRRCQRRLQRRLSLCGAYHVHFQRAVRHDILNKEN